MKTFLTISALRVFCSLTLRSGRRKPAAIELKNKSAFTMEASGRNPFWPIGWKPVAQEPARTSTPGPKSIPRPLSSVRSRVDKGGRFAIINGKAMQVGQQFGLQLGNQTYQITVKAIEDGQVILSRRDEEIIVPLRRK